MTGNLWSPAARSAASYVGIIPPSWSSGTVSPLPAGDHQGRPRRDAAGVLPGPERAGAPIPLLAAVLTTGGCANACTATHPQPSTAVARKLVERPGGCSLGGGPANCMTCAASSSPNAPPRPWSPSCGSHFPKPEIGPGWASPRTVKTSPQDWRWSGGPMLLSRWSHPGKRQLRPLASLGVTTEPGGGRSHAVVTVKVWVGHVGR